MNTVFTSLEELADYFLECGVSEEVVSLMAEKSVAAGNQIQILSPIFFYEKGTRESTPSFTINLAKSVYYDHGSYTPKSGKKGGHLNQLVSALGGTPTKGATDEASDTLVEYIKLVMAKYGDGFPKSFPKKPLWTVDAIRNNSSIGYDEGSNSLVFFTFTIKGNEGNDTIFELTHHAQKYPLAMGNRVREWVNLKNPGQRDDPGFQERVIFISHPALSTNGQNFYIPNDRVGTIIGTEGEPDAVTVSLFAENTLGVSWKNYDILQMSPDIRVHILSDAGGEDIAEQTARNWLSAYDNIVLHAWHDYASGADYEAKEESFDDDLNFDDEDVRIVPHVVPNNFDITDFLERSTNPFVALEKYLELEGKKLSLLERNILPATTLVQGESDAETRSRTQVLNKIASCAMVNTITRSKSGKIQDRVVEGSSFIMSRAMTITGYFAGYGSKTAFVAADFPCNNYDETKCSSCFVNDARKAVASLVTDASTVWMKNNGEIRGIKLRMLPGSVLETYATQTTDVQRRAYLQSYGCTCGYSAVPIYEETLRFSIATEDFVERDPKVYEIVECAPLDHSVTYALDNRKSQELLKLSGYYDTSGKIFIVATVEPQSDAIFSGKYKGRFQSSAHASTVNALIETNDLSSSEEVFETFKKVVTLYEVALGRPGFLDRNFLGNLIVCLHSSSFVGGEVRSMSDVMTDVTILKKSSLYLGNSLFLLGEVSSGKSETLMRLGKIFPTVQTKNYSDIKETQFRPSAARIGDKIGFSFEHGRSCGGLFTFDGMQANTFRRNPLFDALNIGIFSDSEDYYEAGADIRNKFEFSWVDTPLQRGFIEAQGILASSTHGEEAILLNAPLIFTGNFKVDARIQDTDLLQAFYNFAYTVRGNVQAISKRFSPTFARKGNVSSSEEPTELSRRDAIFIITDIKLFQLQTLFFSGSGDRLFSEAQATVQVSADYMREAVGRRALAIANMFRILRRSHSLSLEDIQFAVRLIEDSAGEYFQYSDVRVHRGDKPTETKEKDFVPQSPLDYNPEGSQFAHVMRLMHPDEAREVLRQLFIKQTIGGSKVWVLDLAELAYISANTDPINFFGVAESQGIKMARRASYENVRKIAVPTPFYESVKRFIDRL